MDCEALTAENERLREVLRALGWDDTQPAEAWDNEDGDQLVIYGTHDPEEASAAVSRYLKETGTFLESDAMPDWENDADLFWIHPASTLLEDYVPEELVSDQFVEGWVPGMIVNL